MARTIVVGDVHGCYREMRSLLKKIDYSASRDRLIFVGDLLNKGPESFKVMRYVEKIDAEVVIGNHELKFLRFLENPRPGNPRLAELKLEMGRRLGFWRDWILRMPAFIEEKDYLVVHGGLEPGIHPNKTPIDILTTIRTWDGEGKVLNDLKNPSWYSLYSGKKHVIFGHWAANGLTLRENVSGLDSGCVYGNELSAMILPTQELVQVSAQRTYSLAV